MIKRKIINFEQKIKKFKHARNYKLQNDFVDFSNFSKYFTTSPLRAYQLHVSFIKCLKKSNSYSTIKTAWNRVKFTPKSAICFYKNKGRYELIMNAVASLCILTLNFFWNVVYVNSIEFNLLFILFKFSLL